ncbi:endo-1,4-beta-xylanase C [Xanthomonas phage SB4]|uniref:Endo-1,4-beta-xylanase C n=1 Tax=Xanthomonas phage SB4 TaxID=3117473 RepID=A0ABZ2GZL7_9CAUD
MHFRLFNRPTGTSIKAGRPVMWIDGLYYDYEAGAPYEGRVQIHGSTGLMKVEVLGQNLPPGASVYIDQVTKEVVVKWGLYTPPTEEVKSVPNGNFDEGYAYWETVGPGTPISFETGWSPNNKGNCTYRDHKGEYTIRGGWAPVSSSTRQIEITAKVEHGKSSKGNASCAVGLAWFDEKKNLIREDWGNAVTNGGKGRWYDTKLFTSAKDKEIKFVRPTLKFGRRKQNHPIHAAQVQWDHVYVIGYNEDDILWVEVKVTDAIGNIATHKGYIEERSNWYFGKINGLYAVESLNITTAIQRIAQKTTNWSMGEASSIGASVTGLRLKAFVTHRVSPTPEGAALSASVARFTVKNEALRISANNEPMDMSISVSGFKSKTHVTYVTRPESITYTTALTRFKT